MRFGSRFGGPSQHPTGVGRAPGIVPANAGVGGSVQASLDALASASARRQKEAISNIDSVNLFLWQPLSEGDTCSCRGGEPPVAPNVDPNVISVSDTPAEPSINDGFGTIKVQAFDVSPAYRHTEFSRPIVSDAEPAHHGGATSDSDVNIPSADPDALLHGFEPTGSMPGGPGNDPALHEWDDTDGLFSEDLMAEFEGDTTWNPEMLLADNAYLLGPQTTACPLCLNTGFVGGYSLWGGTHRILPVEYVNDYRDAVLDDDSAKVPVWTVEPGGWLEWNTNLPSYFTVAWVLARNNKQHALGFAFAFSVGEAQSVSDLSTLSSQALDNLTVKITNVSDVAQKVTHADITVRHMPLRGQVTNLTMQAGTDQRVKADPITVTLPADVGIISHNSIIAEAKYNLVWRVTTVETISDASLRVTSVSASTKLLGVSEVEATLYPMLNVRYGAQLLYTGVEPHQGNR